MDNETSDMSMGEYTDDGPEDANELAQMLMESAEEMAPENLADPNAGSVAPSDASQDGVSDEDALGMTQGRLDEIIEKRLGKERSRSESKLSELEAMNRALLERVAKNEGVTLAQMQASQQQSEQAPQFQMSQLPEDADESTKQFVAWNDQRFAEQRTVDAEASDNRVKAILAEALKPFAGLQAGLHELQEQRRYNVYEDAMAGGVKRHAWLKDSGVRELVQDRLVSKFSGDGRPQVTPQSLAAAIDEFATKYAPTFAGGAGRPPAPRGMAPGRGTNGPLAPKVAPESWDQLIGTLTGVGRRIDQKNEANQNSLASWRNKG